MIQSFLLLVHGQLGDTAFVLLMIAVGVAVSIRVIPHTTDMMVNAAAGLAEKHLGAQYRTLIINCSTNNPELITMLLALFFSGKQGVGGIGTPLGSNFANIYLIFFVAFIWLFVGLWLRDRVRFYDLLALIRRERRLVFWHVGVAVLMFLLASVGYQALTSAIPPSKWSIAGLTALCCIGVGMFIWLESRLRRSRADVFHDIDDEEHVASWRQLFIGTAGLMAACYVVNSMFVVSTTLYSTTLAGILGKSVFAAMHYFLGALITSLPELNVAVSNYRKLTAPDLNTGLASASASNMSNLAIAGVGGLIALFII